MRHTSIPSRIIIADDHPLFRSALRSLLEESPDLKVLAEAADGQEALELCHRFEPDVVLMDVVMPRTDGIAATHAIKAQLPHIIVLVMTASEDLAHLTHALRAGAAGYILKTASAKQITNAIRRVLEGESPLNQEITMRLLMHLLNEKREWQEEEPVNPAPEALPQEQRRTPAAALQSKLSPREVEVLNLLTRGHTNQQIAEELLLSTSTVKNHVQHILSKLGVSDRTQAAIMAIELGFIILTLCLCSLVEYF